MRVLSTSLFIVLCLLQYKLWFSTEGIIQTVRLKHQVGHQQLMNHQQLQRNQALQRDIDHLRSHAMVEALARQELGLVKPGETYYQFVRSSATPASVAN